jgi:hypothetical protein
MLPAYGKRKETETMKLCQEISDATKIEIVQVSGMPDFTFPTLCSLLMCAT